MERRASLGEVGWIGVGGGLSETLHPDIEVAHSFLLVGLPKQQERERERARERERWRERDSERGKKSDRESVRARD